MFLTAFGGYCPVLPLLGSCACLWLRRAPCREGLGRHRGGGFVVSRFPLCFSSPCYFVAFVSNCCRTPVRFELNRGPHTRALPPFPCWWQIRFRCCHWALILMVVFPFSVLLCVCICGELSLRARL